MDIPVSNVESPGAVPASLLGADLRQIWTGRESLREKPGCPAVHESIPPEAARAAVRDPHSADNPKAEPIHAKLPIDLSLDVRGEQSERDDLFQPLPAPHGAAESPPSRHVEAADDLRPPLELQWAQCRPPGALGEGESSH